MKATVIRSVSVTVLTALAGAGCEFIQPRLNVEVTAVTPCNQANALAGVGIMEVRAEAEDGTSSRTSSKLSSGSTDLSGLAISDGTVLFMNGYQGEGADALDGVPIASGASVPLDLASHVAENRLPPANRNYGSVGVLLGKVNAFGKTTSLSDKSCTSLAQARHGHTATYSRATGKVYVIGGLNYAQSDGAEAFVPRTRALEVYDPNTGMWETATLANNVGPLMERAFHTATELPDGSILVIGGVGPDGDGTVVSPRAASFILNPTNFSAVTLGASQGFQLKRFHHQATLAGNNVIITGGCGCRGSLTAADIMAGRCPPASEQCTDGTPYVAAVDRFDIADRRIQTITTAVMSNPRAFHTASLLSGGLLILAGGNNGQNTVGPIEILRTAPSVEFIPGTADTLAASAVTHAGAVVLSSDDCTSLLADHPVGSECVLLVGGCTQVPAANGTCATVQSTATIWDFGRAPGSRVVPGPASFRPRWGHHVVYLPRGSNMVLAAGGWFDDSDSPPVSAEVLPRRANMGGVTPFAPAPPPYMDTATTRGALAVIPPGQLLFVGGEQTTVTGTQRESSNTAEFFFHPLQ